MVVSNCRIDRVGHEGPLEDGGRSPSGMDVVTTDAFEEVEAQPGVYLAQLATEDEMSIQHLRMAPDAVIPEHGHHHEQVGFVYEGKQTFVLDGDETVTVAPGESYRLASEAVHGAENRADAEMRAIDVFSPPRPNPDWLE